MVRVGWILVVTLAGWVLGAGPASAQYSSLARREAQRPKKGAPKPLSLVKASWTAIEHPKSKTISRNDIVTVLVSELSESVTESEFDRETKGKLEATLEDWVRLKDGSLFENARIASQKPSLKGKLDSKLEKDADVLRKDRMRDRIAATVVDVRPNRILVLEAHKRFSHNEELVELKLTGEVRYDDVLPNNTVMSEDIANLRIVKVTRGAAHGATKRGWLLWLIDIVDPF